MENFFPVLYSTNKLGKELCWEITVDDNTVVREYGQIGGKKIVTRREYEAKNVGKKNETSAEQQALFDAQKLWVSQLKKDYRPKDDKGIALYSKVMGQIDAQGGNLHNIRGTNNDIRVDTAKGTIPREKVYVPMKAEPWEKARSIDACYVQPKLDGVRGVAFLVGDDVHITSRNGKEFVFLTDVKKALYKVLTPGLVLDGEMYYHTPEPTPEKFRIINGACRSKRNAPSEHEHLIQYHVFDVVSDKPWHERLAALEALPTNEKVVRVDTKYLPQPDEDELYNIRDTYIQQGYEGAMVRVKDGVYEHRRTTKLLKLKREYDAEYTITGIVSGKGTEEGCAIYELETDTGKKFMCRPRGTFEDRKKMLEDMSVIGKPYTVYYQDIDKKTGIPIHARGKAVRYD